MKLVIDISEEDYEKIKKAYSCIFGDIYYIMQNAIAKGTPLPKGYERFIDAFTYEDCASKADVKEQMLKHGFSAPDMTVTEFVDDCLPSVIPWIDTSKSDTEMCKCFICNKEIQRDSIPRIEPKLNSVRLGEDAEDHPICDACGNLLSMIFSKVTDGK